MTRGPACRTLSLGQNMSDRNSESSSEDKYEKLNGKCDDICRDFLRNVCRRGKRCRYRHPEAVEAKELGKQQEYTFCHDYQNTGCRRLNCKFLHCTREEEEYCKQTSQLPVRLQQAAALGIGVAPRELPLLKGEIPVCIDYLKGECKRGAKCKFRHLSVAEYEYELPKSANDHRNNHHQKQDTYDPAEDDFDRFENRFDYGHSASKRRRADLDGFSTSFESRYPSIRPLSYQLLDEENNMLRRKVEEMKKQIADLTAANEVLLEQNARYRVSKSNHVQTINVPVSQALSVGQTLATAGVATAGVAPTPSQQQLNHMNNSLAQQIAMNNDLVSQHAMQQRLAREQLGPPPAQCSIPTQSLNPSVTINPPTIVPVSLPQTNISAVSLSQASLQQTLPASVSLAQRPSHQNLAMSAQTSPLVSYPIVSQSMRTPVPQSSLAH